MDIDERLVMAAQLEQQATELERKARGLVQDIEEIEAERGRLLREARRLRKRPIAERVIGGEE